MPLKEEPAWRAWMREFGTQQRRLRETLGLSQERLATLSGVSQGAVSRLESGRALATPLLVVLKINLAFARQIRRLDPSIVNPGLLRLADVLETVSPAVDGVGVQIEPFLHDAEARVVLDLVRGVADRRRRQLVAVIRATARALATGDAGLSADGDVD